MKQTQVTGQIFKFLCLATKWDACSDRLEKNVHRCWIIKTANLNVISRGIILIFSWRIEASIFAILLFVSFSWNSGVPEIIRSLALPPFSPKYYRPWLCCFCIIHHSFMKSIAKTLVNYSKQIIALFRHSQELTLLQTYFVAKYGDFQKGFNRCGLFLSWERTSINSRKLD